MQPVSVQSVERERAFHKHRQPFPATMCSVYVFNGVRVNNLGRTFLVIISYLKLCASAQHAFLPCQT
jgi:hypothetical protein